MDANRFFIGFALSSALLVTAVAATNYFVDVSGTYSSGNASYDVKFAQTLSITPEGIIFAAGSERLVKQELLKLKEADCYVTGSSHEMTLNLRKAPQLREYCSSLLNLAASGGGYEDALITLHALSDHGSGLVIVGIGHWFFKFDADPRWQELGKANEQAHAYFLGKEIQSGQLHDDRMANLVNGRYLLRNLETVINGRPMSDLVAARPENLSDKDPVLLPDGSLQYSREFVRNTLPRKEMKNCAEASYKISRPFVDAAAVAQFEIAISKTLASGKKVALLLMPYHPGVYQCGGDPVKALVETEAVARNIGASLGIPVWGGYVPSVHGLQGEDFYDYHHVDANSLWAVRLD